MSRNPIKKKKYPKLDPFYNSSLIQKITNQLTKKGKKNLARKILNQAIRQIEKKTQKDPIQVIEQAISNTVPAVEIKARRIGGAIYSIPIELNTERGISVAIRWIIQCCNTKTNQAFVYKLATEFIEASNKMGAAVKKRDEIHKIAESSARLM